MAYVAVDEECLQICLLGTPVIRWRGRALTIRPPLAFQALVAVALAPGQASARANIAKQLFGHLPPTSRSNQARLALRKLKRQLEQAEFDDLIEWNEVNVRIVTPCQIDIGEAIEGRPCGLEDIEKFAEPILLGCNTKLADDVRRTAKNWIEAGLPSIHESIHEASDLRSLAATLGRLREAFPQSALICAYRCVALKRLQFAEEYTREIVAFESDWLDALGLADRPDIPTMVANILASGQLVTLKGAERQHERLDARFMGPSK